VDQWILIRSTSNFNEAFVNGFIEILFEYQNPNPSPHPITQSLVFQNPKILKSVGDRFAKKKKL
jgi:hypothetical protein